MNDLAAEDGARLLQAAVELYDEQNPEDALRPGRHLELFLAARRIGIDPGHPRYDNAVAYLELAEAVEEDEEYARITVNVVGNLPAHRITQTGLNLLGR